MQVAQSCSRHLATTLSTRFVVRPCEMLRRLVMASSVFLWHTILWNFSQCRTRWHRWPLGRSSTLAEASMQHIADFGASRYAEVSPRAGSAFQPPSRRPVQQQASACHCAGWARGCSAVAAIAAIELACGLQLPPWPSRGEYLQHVLAYLKVDASYVGSSRRSCPGQIKRDLRDPRRALK